MAKDGDIVDFLLGTILNLTNWLFNLLHNIKDKNKSNIIIYDYNSLQINSILQYIINRYCY